LVYRHREALKSDFDTLVSRSVIYPSLVLVSRGDNWLQPLRIDFSPTGLPNARPSLFALQIPERCQTGPKHHHDDSSGAEKAQRGMFTLIRTHGEIYTDIGKQPKNRYLNLPIASEFPSSRSSVCQCMYTSTLLTTVARDGGPLEDRCIH
jgi:hypothetical protein